MPFDSELEPVYTDAIKPAVECVRDLVPDLTVYRADRKYQTNKMDFIREHIRAATLVIIDITGMKPSVMWELGFADACGKEMIVIGNIRPNELPFNLKNLDFLDYGSDRDGISALKHKLSRTIKEKLSAAMTRRSSYLDHERWTKTLKQNENTLRHVPKSSLLSIFVRRELSRNQDQMARLADGHYVLRNERPMEEIIDCYCDLVEALDDDSSTFDTITCAEFWRDFTDRGTDNRYSSANVGAAMNGARIRRVLLLDKDGFGNNKQFLTELKGIVTRHCDITSPQRDRIHLKMFESSNYVADLLSTYENFALLCRRKETLLLKPSYDQGNGRRMLETQFWHVDRGVTEEREDNLKRIKKYRSRFDILFERAEDLTTDAIEAYFGKFLP